MDKKYIFDNLSKILDKKDIFIDEKMSRHISFRVGGPADFLVLPRSQSEIVDVIEFAKSNSIPYFLLGNGSNLIVKDKGIRGIVIKIGKNFSDFSIDGNVVVASAGVLLSYLSKHIMKESLKGFEFASGIPGTLGGAVVMNAGAYGSEMRDIVSSVKVLKEDGNIYTYTNDDMQFGYRTSRLSNNKDVVLEVTMVFERGDYDIIKSTAAEYTMKRTTKQPLSLPSAGSTFKRPEGNYAGKLIEDSGLKGMNLRGAQVSSKHCGFVVNSKGAAASDILDLLDIIKKSVYENFDVLLQEEVKIVGED